MSNIVCPECGNAFDDGMGFCPKCGRELPGASAKAVRRETVARSGDPVADGFAMMAADDYEGAMAAWNEALTGGTVPDDDLYARMVSAAGACMLSLSSTSEVKMRPGTSDLDILMDDREFALDLLGDIRRRVQECSTQPAVVNLSTNYMLLVTDCFNLYTDLRDLKGICDEAKAFLADVRAREDVLKGDGTMEPATASKFIETNETFMNSLSRTVDHAVDVTPQETLDLLADKWAEQSSLPYVADIVTALRISIQLRVTGKLSSKVFLKTMDSSIQIFVVKYTAAAKQ